MADNDGDASNNKKRKQPPGDVSSTINQLHNSLKDFEQELTEREAKLKKDIEDFEKERKDVYGDTQPSDVLTLNVGGKTMSVLRRTLTSVQGSMLATKFSGRWDDGMEKDKDGNIFIDEDFDVFEAMVNALRDRSKSNSARDEDDSVDASYPFEIDEHTASTKAKSNAFYRMLKYYGISGVLLDGE
jgi:hypothetical protein